MELLEFLASSAFHIKLQISSFQRASEFQALWNQAFSDLRARKTNEKQARESHRRYEQKYSEGSQRTKSAQVKSPHEILEVPVGATLEEITTAYHKKARQYHPDRVEGLGSEFRALAEQRMKEINAAYAELKKQATS